MKWAIGPCCERTVVQPWGDHLSMLCSLRRRSLALPLNAVTELCNVKLHIKKESRSKYTQFLAKYTCPKVGRSCSIPGKTEYTAQFDPPVMVMTSGVKGLDSAKAGMSLWGHPSWQHILTRTHASHTSLRLDWQKVLQCQPKHLATEVRLQVNQDHSYTAIAYCSWGKQAGGSTWR